MFDSATKTMVIDVTKTKRSVFTSSKAKRQYMKSFQQNSVHNTARMKTTLTMDLHHRTTEQAIKQMNDTLEKYLFNESPYNRVNFIVGRGNHSPNGVGVLQQCLLDHVDDQQYKMSVMKANAGILTVVRKYDAR